MANFDVQVEDVYDYAREIFQEFEKIVSITGVDEASMLIHKVKNVFELLENSVQNYEQLHKDFLEAKAKYTNLNNDKFLKEEELKSLKQTYEELEDAWIQESSQMKVLVKKLTAENKILQQKLSENSDTPPDVDQVFKAIIEDQENLISKLKSKLKQKDDRFENDQITIETLNNEITHLNKLNESLHHRYEEAQRIIAVYKQDKRSSVEELKIKNEKLDSLEESFKEMKTVITETCEFNIQNMLDVYKPIYSKQRANEEKFKSLCQEQKKLKQEVKDLKLELLLLKIQMDECEKEFSEVTAPNEGYRNVNFINQLFLEVFDDNQQTHVPRNKRMFAQ